MPTRSPGDDIRELGLPGRAVSALIRAGITSVDDLAVLSRRELAAVPGLGAGMIAAIRQVVPEPARDEGPPSPAIPSFASLRAPQRRTAMDALLPPAPPATGPAPTPPTAGAAPTTPPAGPTPTTPPAGPTPTTSAAAPAAGPRTPEYADLCRLGAELLRAAATAPWRLALWSAEESLRTLRRLAGQ
ncbi:DNA-directed RNA polymerase subunit alpha C-terminal domain-containing protein [Modestobacter marinus]|uniref:DNA-directed RNA polymerase subunit alpha C-terminal domain-containing protein n=1 Tax=Modestobacter marinus TaxID=477641 RepID=UPI001C978C79|nr:DNA-directed RNA polymerase subunit alpha C-terminal domain-containing protein [Modestobacter marinus]